MQRAAASPSAAAGDGRAVLVGKCALGRSAFTVLFWPGNIGAQGEEDFGGPVPPAATRLRVLKFFLRCVFRRNNPPSSSVSDAPGPVPECPSSPPLPADHVLDSGAVLFPGSASSHLYIC